ncbi:hypothetical protein [Vibrio maritimus]|uniref:hypothetical protein n=1 Tax=Vibrio maritimus TaxID=990268 RepID=UPI0037354910
MELTTKTKAIMARCTYNLLLEAYKSRQVKRVEEFMKFVDLRYESMASVDQVKLNDYINSETGQEILANFADSITQTSSRRVRMATALLYCQDCELDFSKSEKITFVSAIKDLDDDMVNFFLKVCQLERQTVGLPYPRAGIHHNNHYLFRDCGWDEEATFVYINDLIRLRLLLPDPKSFSVVAGDGTGWAVWFGVTDRSLRIASLLNKAESLLIEI